MTQHTPGPWSAEGGDLVVAKQAGRWISRPYDNVYPGFEGFDENCANARLIASAPEMLEALHRVVECFGATHKDLYAIQKAHDAIEKAEGTDHNI